jgi:PAS domain-containing protein
LKQRSFKEYGGEEVDHKNDMTDQEVRDALEYAEDIVATVHQSLLILDQDLKVVSASRYFYEVFKVAPEATEKQSVYDLGDHQWDIPKLRELLEEILPKTTTFDNFEVEHDFPGLGKRTMLLNARQIVQKSSDRKKLILIAIEDITEAKRALDGLHDKIVHLESDLRVADRKAHTIAGLKAMVDELQRRILRKGGHF